MTGDGASRGGSDDRAVSPVIAVILMVAMTVILAAAVGVYGLSFGSETREDPPRVAWDHNVYFDDSTDELETLEIVHNGGGELDTSRVEVTIDGTDAGSASGLTYSPPPDPMNAGDVMEFDFQTGTPGYSAGTEIRIVWYDDEEQETSVIHTYELPRDTE